MIELAAAFLRIALLPAFILLAVEDIRTRTCPRWVWYPIVALGLLALTIEATAAHGSPAWTFLWMRVIGGLIVLGPVAALLWLSPAGNADAKAFLAIALAFPTAPFAVPSLWGAAIPFAITVFLNSMILAVPLTVALAAIDRLERGVPFLAYLAAGLFVGVFVGDLALLLLRVIG